ncbi:MAG: hypothetical protein GY884_19450 [Proteobacteria bacterium]|nr:hypothetical protein [Pseudomonadota bacterium]
MTRTPHRLWCLAVALSGALASGCVLDGGEPEIEQVSPDWAWTGEATDIVIEGTDFFPQPTIDSSRGVERVDDAFQVMLVADGASWMLEGVELVSWSRIEARVPEGLPVDNYDLRLLSPTGREAVVTRGFTITDSRADHLSIDFEARPYDVHEQAVVRFELLDPLGERVRDDLRVAVEVEADVSLSSIEVAGTGLGDPDADLGELIGTLADGEGWVAVSSTEPANIWLTVSPDDPDSPIDMAQVFIPVTTGDLDSVDVSLPTQTFSATAGEAFDVTFVLRDDKGSALPDTSARLYLSEACHGPVVPDEIDFVGSTTTPITLLRATDTDCDATRIQVTGSATGQSGAFEVAADEVALLQVRATDSSPESLVAGEPDLMLRVTARDGYMNKVADYDRPIHFRDDVGGLDTLSGVGSLNCVVEWDAGERFCLVGLERAADEVYIEAYDGLGLSGETEDPVAVLPAAPAELIVEHSVSEVAAGEEIEVHVWAEDAFGNRVSFDPVGANPIDVDDGQGTAACTWASELEDQHTLSCITTTASLSTALELEIPTLGLVAQSDVFSVTNSTLSELAVTAPSSVTAGETFTISLQGRDAYGNAYTVGNPAVELRDTSGTLSPASVSLDGTGAFSGSAFTITVSGSSTITGSAGGTDLGSTALDVLSAELSFVDLSIDEPYAWTGVEVELTVRGVDAYGNTVESFSGPVSLSSESGLFISSTLTDFTDGEGTTTLTWDTAGLQDRVLGSDTTVSGSSRRVDAIDDCSEGPTAVLELDSASETVACILSGTATVTADFSSSATGASALSAYHLHDGQDGWTRGTTDTSTVSTTASGVYTAELVVVDSSACGSHTTARLWAAEQGEPAGPLTVETSDDTRTAGGSSSTADATITITAEDCAGDVPTTTTLYTRTDLGDLSTASSSTQGLTVSLSGSTASTTWSAQSTSYDGTATVHVGTLDNAAYGAVTIDVTGESSRPRVRRVDPMGDTSELFDTVTVEFSEDLLASVDHDTLVSVDGPDGEASLTTAVSGDTLTVTLDEEGDAAGGAWALTVSKEIRDEAGNKLDGAFDGTNADFISLFGDVGASGASMQSCTADTTITPDGNAGVGDEVHDLDVTATADAIPTWWLLEIFDSSATAVRNSWVAATSSSDIVVWDGTGDDGFVVAAGVYTVEVSAIDGSTNVSDACSLDVRVVEHYGAPSE